MRFLRLILAVVVLAIGAGAIRAGGQCEEMPDGTPCNDGNFCSSGETCQGGVCTGGGPSGSSFCDDGNLCTAQDTCVGTTCAGSSYSCNDNNPCTDETCEPEEGCVYTPNSNSCNDNDACTTGDQCSGGTCVGGSPPECDDGNACTTDDCYSTFGCAHAGNHGQACDDGDACTTDDACNADDGQTCVGTLLDCDDANLCTADSCNSASGCTHLPQPNLPCDDGNACTADDTCDTAGTTCEAGSPVVCTALDECHVAGTCDPGTGCSNPNVPDGTTCADADVCNGEEACLGGVCGSGFGPNCDDDNPCTTDTCDAQSGCSNAVVTSGTPCDDLDACDGLELCEAGTCTPGAPLDCADTTECTDDLCFPIKRETRTYAEVTAAASETTVMLSLLAAPAGGLIVYTTAHYETREDPQYGTITVIVQVLKFAVDSERVQSIDEGGGPRPIAAGESFELARTEPQGGGPEFSYIDGQLAAATDLGNGRTGVVVPYSVHEGGCTFINQLGGPECVKPLVTHDLNGDSDPFDSMVAYAAIEIDRPTKTILSVTNVITDTEGHASFVATNGRKIVHVDPEHGDFNCWFPGGNGGYCYGPAARIDRNHDGRYSSVLSLHDVESGQTVYTLLKGGIDFSEHPTAKMSGDVLAFQSQESFNTPDFNDDGDLNDVILRHTSIDQLFAQPALTPANGPELLSGFYGELKGVEGTLLTYSQNYKLRIYDTVTRGDVSTDSPYEPGIAGVGQVAGGIQAIPTREGQEFRADIPSTDYNDDGDHSDVQLRFYEHATRTVVTTNIAHLDADGDSPTEWRQEGTSDGEIIAYAHTPYPGTPPTQLEIRYIRVAPCTPAPCGEEGEHCFNADVSNDAACGDGEACNGSETCQAGVCTSGTPVACNDDNQCTSDVCIDGFCQHPQLSGACNDADGCTINDNCDFGFCTGTPISPPAEVQDVQTPDKTTVTWSAAPMATSYDVVRGSVAALEVGPGGGDEVCLGPVATESLTDLFNPPPGVAVWYVVRGDNACGSGSWGTQSNLMPRDTTTCP